MLRNQKTSVVPPPRQGVWFPLVFAGLALWPSCAGAQALPVDCTTGSDGTGLVCGGYNTASNYDVALGLGNSLTTGSSMAVGLGNAVSAGVVDYGYTGYNTAIGINNTLAGPSLSVLGGANTLTGKALGAFGDSNTLTGVVGYAIGSHNTISANDTFAFGEYNHVYSGSNETVVSGYLNTVKGALSAVYGNENVAQDVATGAAIVGSGNYYSGDRTAILGNYNGYGTGEYYVAVGTFNDYNNVSGAYSTAIGYANNYNVAGGAYSIALGADNSASGQKSTAIGYSADSTGASAIAVGDSSAATAAGAMALGTGATAAQAGSVALGSGSATAGVQNTTGIVLAGTTYSFAGSSATSTVSVGAAGSERTVTNVAAGRVSATSTDAVNGSQLYAAYDQIALLQAELAASAGEMQAVADWMTQVDLSLAQLMTENQTLKAGIAISSALATPVLADGQSFAVRLGWGTYAGANAVALNATGILARGMGTEAGSLAVDGGVGMSIDDPTNFVGRAGVTLGW